MQLAELRFSETYGTALHHTGDDATDGVSLPLHLCYQTFHACSSLKVGTTHGIGFYL